MVDRAVSAIITTRQGQVSPPLPRGDDKATALGHGGNEQFVAAGPFSITPSHLRGLDDIPLEPLPTCHDLPRGS